MTLNLTAEQREIVAQAKAITKGSQSERNRALRAELFHAYRTHEDGVSVVRAWAEAGKAQR